jgi:RND family efflux transporter MFP subunit
MDLSALKIDRSKERAPARRSQSRWFGRVLFLVVVGGLLFLFRRPLLGFVDRWSLPEVRVLEVSESRASAAGAIEGTAANGYIVARTRAALSADTPGRIVELNVTEGQAVPKGFVVARLYSDEVEALLARAEADLALARAGVTSARAQVEVARAAGAEAQTRATAAEADVADAGAGLRWAGIEKERARTLAAEGIGAREREQATEVAEEQAAARLAAARAAHETSLQAVATSELELASSEARVREAEALVAVKEAEREQARATLDKLAVRAPFDGVIVLKDAEIGEVVSPNAVGAQSRGSVATMVDFASLEVQVEVPEANLSAVVLDSPARIFLDAYPDKGYQGRVLRIWPTANRQKATVEVRVGFADPDERLRPEMGARVVFTRVDAPAPSAGEAEPVILLARSAVVPLEGRAHVFVLERDVARLRAVELGPERSGRVVVESGLADGELVIDAPPADLADGERVRVGG